jgi:hypothetical protein
MQSWGFLNNLWAILPEELRADQFFWPKKTYSYGTQNESFQASLGALTSAFTSAGGARRQVG